MQARDNYFSLTKEELFAHFSVGNDGLTKDEAAKRLTRYGPNVLTPKKPVSAFVVYLSQFKNSLIMVLLISAALIFFVWLFGERDQSDLIESGLILTIVLLITFLGFVQEYKAEKAVEALKKLLAFKARVIRHGEELEVDVSTLVPGDMVVLEEGMKIPADIRLIDVASLQVNEASLTGESAPVTKQFEAILKHVQLADQKNMIFAGTAVTQGRATGVVVATGDHTEIGKIAHDVADVKDEATPIQRRLDEIGKILGYGVLGISIVVFIFIVFFAKEYFHLTLFQRILHSFIAAVSLAVAAVPEGLPAVVTIALALGTQRMLGKHALIRRLNSAETLGSTDVICADKTGTLTKGEMTVTELFTLAGHATITGTGYEADGSIKTEADLTTEFNLMLKTGLLCNNAVLKNNEQFGDPTELALIISAAKGKVTAHDVSRQQEIPFSSERKMMSVLVKEQSKLTIYTKGAPEIILAHCTKILQNSQVVTLNARHKKQILAEIDAMSGRALRTLGFAYRPVGQSVKVLEQELIFIGLQAMIDPPRSEIKNLVATCVEAGIRTIMITGDHIVTAQAVAKEIGLIGKALTGEQLERLSDAQFQRTVEEISVYARVNPGMKMRIVAALKKQGHIVAMTGDGVNDAPALKKSDMGIAMGITGTDVAKEAADMVLLDDKFGTIVAAIEEGRGIFDNIRKFVNYLLSCNIAEVLVVFLAVMLFQDLPLTAIMLLWINVVTDGLPAIALGLDPAEKGIMGHKPKKFQGEIIDRRLWIEMIVFGILLTLAVLWLYWHNLSEGIESARGIAFTAIVLFELVRLIIIRTDYKASFTSNRWLLAAIGLSIVLHLVIVYNPSLAKLFNIGPIDLGHWLTIGLLCGLLWISYEFVIKVLEKLSLIRSPETM